MVSERLQRQTESLLDEAEAAIKQLDWRVVHDRAQAVLAIDPEHTAGLALPAIAERSMGSSAAALAAGPTTSTPISTSATTPDQPTSFANGRYQVRRFLGEGGKKKVYLAHGTLLDREVAFALINTEGLDDAGRSRISREAQAIGRLGPRPHIVTT